MDHLSNLLTLQCIIRERFNRNTKVVHTGDAVPSKRQTSSRGHQASRSRRVNQKGRLTTDKRIALSNTFNRAVLHSFHHIEVLNFKDFSQLGIGDEGSVRHRSTTIQASQNVRVVDEDVTGVFTNNHRVRLEPTRLKLHGTTSSRNVRDRSCVGVIRPLVHLTSRWSASNTFILSAPDRSREEGRSKLLFTMDQDAVHQSGSTSRTEVQHFIFVSKGLLIEVHTQTIHIGIVRAVRQRHADTVYFSTRCQLLNVTSTVHVVTVVDVVLV